MINIVFNLFKEILFLLHSITEPPAKSIHIFGFFIKSKNREKIKTFKFKYRKDDITDKVQWIEVNDFNKIIEWLLEGRLPDIDWSIWKTFSSRNIYIITKSYKNLFVGIGGGLIGFRKLTDQELLSKRWQVGTEKITNQWISSKDYCSEFEKRKLTENMKYYLIENDEKTGPFSIEELNKRDIYKETLIWTKGLDDWTEAKNIPMLKDIIDQTPPAYKSSKKTYETPPEPPKTQKSPIEYFGYKLASKWERLIASLVGGLIMLVPILLITKGDYLDGDSYVSIYDIIINIMLALIVGGLMYPIWSGNIGHKIFGIKTPLNRYQQPKPIP